MRVRVIRSPGGRPDPSVLIDPMVVDERLAAERGRNHLADQGYSKILSRYSVPPMAMPLPGDLVRVDERSAGRTTTGRVTSWSLAVEAGGDGLISASAEIELERRA